MGLNKVLVANRGEIAARVIQACHDEGILAVAVYADQDRDARFVRLADEAFSLGGDTGAQTYLSVDTLLEVAAEAGADAVHPGYGFLSENAEFATAVSDAGLLWIGPPAEAIRRLGDKVSARRIAERVGAPLAPGTSDPVTTGDEIRAFAAECGYPVAIKAASGGGGRGMKVVHDDAEVDAALESATREAVAAFGEGTCFVEKFLERPRHVETQCLADRHGTVMVVSTRDCSVQRRHQKLIEEAPAPFLTKEQNDLLVSSSRALLKEVGYVGAGTCEFLVGADGTISFLEVNTRLQVEHPVSEEVTGRDLVRDQLRIADGARLDTDDPVTVGHAIELRINAEDASRGFLPATGRIVEWEPASGIGVRLETGVAQGDVVGAAFDSMLAKLIVRGADRTQALERARRAVTEFRLGGVPSVLPFHDLVLRHPAFVAADGAFGTYTQWVEKELGAELAQLEPGVAETIEDGQEDSRTTLVAEVNGRRVQVTLPAQLGAVASPRPSTAKGARRRAAKADPGALRTPLQGTVTAISATDGDTVAAGDPVLVVEAMKMEHPVLAHRAGTIAGLSCEVGDALAADAVICTIVQ